MSTPPSMKERTELDRLRQVGRELGASFMPLTKRQAAAVRAILLGSTGRNQEQQIEE